MRSKKDPHLKLAETLMELKKRGTNFSVLSKRVNIPASTLASWAAGATPTDHAALLRLAKDPSLSLSLEELLFGKIQNKEINGSTTLSTLLEQSIKKEVFSGRFEVELKIKKISG